MCKCISYNRPESYQVDSPMVLQPLFSEKTVCIDFCITNQIIELWEAGFETLGSCCGHNEEDPSVVVDNSIAKEVRAYVDNNFKRLWKVLAWDLVEY